MIVRCTLMLCAAAATAAAQSTTLAWAPAPGTHIRGHLFRPDGAAIDGWVVRYDDNVAEIAPCAECETSTQVPIDSVFALESASSGRHFLRHVGKWTIAGAGAGGTVGLLAGVGTNCNGADGPCGPGFTVPVGIVFGGAAGLLLGVVSAALPAREVWTPVRRP